MLAVAVTVIEVGLIVMLMVGGGKGASTYARDTVFAAVMITLNGIVGLESARGRSAASTGLLQRLRIGCGADHGRDTGGRMPGAARLHRQQAGLEYSTSQLAFAAVVSLTLYCAFVFTQTVRHRDFFVPVASDSNGRVTGILDEDGEGHADPPSARGPG